MATKNLSKKRKQHTPLLPAYAVAATEERIQVPEAGDYLQVKWLLEEPDKSHDNVDSEWAPDQAIVGKPVEGRSTSRTRGSDGRGVAGDPTTIPSLGEVWWPCKVVTMDIHTRTGTILYSAESSGPGLDLMGNCRDSSEAEDVEIVQGGMRHTDHTNEPVLLWRFTPVTDVVLHRRSEVAPETSSHEGVNLQNKVAELERVVTTLATARMGTHTPLSSNASSRAKTVLHVLARSEAYHALFKKDPKSVKNFIDRGLGPMSGCDVVSPSHIASRGTNCTLNEFQDICALIVTGTGRQTVSAPLGGQFWSGSTFTGRHGMIRMRPSAFGVHFPNLNTRVGAHRDALVVEFEAYGDMLDCLGMTETPRLITVGTAREKDDVKHWVWVVGTSIWVKGGSGDSEGGNAPVRHMFPCRSPFGPSHTDPSPACFDNCENGGVCSWEVELLTQPDTRILNESSKTMRAVFEAKTKKTKDVDIELGKQLDDVEETGTKFSIAWNPATQGIPKGVVDKDVPGLLTCRFPVTIVRSNQLADSVLSLLDENVAEASRREDTKARTDRVLRPLLAGQATEHDQQPAAAQL